MMKREKRRAEMVDARSVANRFLDLAAGERRALTPMQVLKLVYIAHGWNLAINDGPLIDQPVEAWQYGPVIRDLYQSMKGFGGSTVTGPLSTSYGANAANMDAREVHVVDQVYRLYGRKTGTALSRITHAPNTPWSEAYTPAVHGIVLSTDSIAEHYKRLQRERSPRQNA
jgi:uncharacterized phage-associated protein